MKQKNGSGFKAPLGILLIGISAVLVLTLVISIFMNSSKMKSIEDSDHELYYDMLYTISTTLINADRDLYQAESAALHLNAYAQYLPPEMIQSHVSDYKENCQQAYDRVQQAAALAKTNDDLWTEHTTSDGRTFSQIYPEFDSQFKKWQSLYDIDKNEGDIEAFDMEFSTTRDYISDMTDITLGFS